MSIILIALVALAAGFVLIAFISKAAPSASAVAAASGDNWIARIAPEEFQRLLSSLFAEMKFDVESCALSGGDVDVVAVNPTPMTGARIYVRGVLHPPLGLVGEDEVRVALETARAEMAGKAIVVTPGGFTPDAKASAKGTPVDLLDGVALLALVKKHLPQIAAERRL